MLPVLSVPDVIFAYNPDNEPLHQIDEGDVLDGNTLIKFCPFEPDAILIKEEL